MAKRKREEYERGLPGYHDPMAGFAGAPYGRSALTLRLWLAGFGLVFCGGAAALVFLSLPELTWLGWALVVLAVAAAIDFAWVAHRKRRGEPG
ncbi:DUF6343 family protein [Saccharopolyspora phatthalungensis]|uniref:Uncharacterized protein n=1 Tax=Saccharopolyspora phatthalungensis TaxID=664693 RepID=A0A840QHV0_9PSEU|nr:DUF6343 family protein [Saccharopolyspora phatthalungensis]MBB5159777.1 hypothetical protein [Saccharopolyspora phatthalungensis]